MRLLSLALALALIATPALARTKNRQVPANKSTIVGKVGVFNSDNCTFGPIPKLKIITPPSHGKVTFKKTMGTIKQMKCRGTKIKAMSIIYTPKRGYRGKDNFRTRFSYPDYVNGTSRTSVDDKFSILVK